jgi:ribonuclease T1
VAQVARSWLQQALVKTALAAAATGFLSFTPLPTSGLQARETADGVPAVQWSALPAEAQATERLIRAGGPFPYAKDGSVFGNREHKLPRRARGYYREYTVGSAPAHGRGARRIVCGGARPTDPEACYYTDDHYASFRRIAP